jgi:hypothetical protein
VFEGGGFGVGVAVTLIAGARSPEEAPPSGVVARPMRLGELMPVAARTDAEIADELQRVDELEGRLAAYRAELVTELAGRRPDTFDLPAGTPGAASPDWQPGPGREAAAGVSEFFATSWRSSSTARGPPLPSSPTRPPSSSSGCRPRGRPWRTGCWTGPAPEPWLPSCSSRPATSNPRCSPK